MTLWTIEREIIIVLRPLIRRVKTYRSPLKYEKYDCSYIEGLFLSSIY